MTFVSQYQNEVLRAIASVDLTKVNMAIEWFNEVRLQGGTIFVAGNGGSAATASHFVCDLLKGASHARETRFRILALTDNLPTLTAYSNNVGYDAVFVEQLKNSRGQVTSTWPSAVRGTPAA